MSWQKIKENLKLAWDRRDQIAEGLYNTYLNHKPEIAEEAERRRKLCEEGTCGFYDGTGTNPRLVVKNQPGCVLCRCNINIKSNCMSCHCSLQDIGETPKWTELMTPDMEKEINEKNYLSQFNKK